MKIVVSPFWAVVFATNRKDRIDMDKTSMMGMPANTNAPTVQREVDRLLHNIKFEVEHQGEVVDTLAGRLARLLNEPLSGIPAMEIESKSELGRALEANANGIHCNTEALMQLLERMQL